LVFSPLADHFGINQHIGFRDLELSRRHNTGLIRFLGGLHF
jgi:hypothetical protein